MRDHFDPLLSLLHQNHHNTNYGNHMQGGIHHQQPSKAVQSLPNNPFGNGSSAAATFSSFAPAVGSYGAVGEKRTNSDENVDCNILQSSLKRVRLSRSPGEFRLQKDLKTLDSMQWGSTHVAANALNFSSTTWIHRSTGARLTMVDSLRICLFLPITAAQETGKYSNNVNPEQQYQHQLHSYHRDYRWRIMIQIPRMYPHNPPVVTRIEGLSLDSIAINEMSPNVQHIQKDIMKEENDGMSSIQSAPGVVASESVFFTETQLARSQTSRTMGVAETGSMAGALPLTGRSGKTIEWNRWSPITGLEELLDFLMRTASSNLASTTVEPSTAASSSLMMGTKTHFDPSMAVTAARMSSCSSSSLSSVSSSSSMSSWGNRNPQNNETGRGAHFLQRGRNNTVTENMMSDENETTTSIRSSVSGASFLSPNRFDVGYGKSSAGHQFASTAGTTPQTSNTSLWQKHVQQQGKQGEEDVGMDMS